jgi:hypothetical protein
MARFGSEPRKCEFFHIRNWNEKLCSVSFGSVTGDALSSGFDGGFTGSKPCKTGKINPGEALRCVVRKLIRSAMVVTPAWRDVDTQLLNQGDLYA